MATPPGIIHPPVGAGVSYGSVTSGGVGGATVGGAAAGGVMGGLLGLLIGHPVTGLIAGAAVGGIGGYAVNRATTATASSGNQSGSSGNQSTVGAGVVQQHGVTVSSGRSGASTPPAPTPLPDINPWIFSAPQHGIMAPKAVTDPLASGQTLTGWAFDQTLTPGRMPDVTLSYGDRNPYHLVVPMGSTLISVNSNDPTVIEPSGAFTGSGGKVLPRRQGQVTLYFTWRNNSGVVQDSSVLITVVA